MALAAQARDRLLKNVRDPERRARDMDLFARFWFNFHAHERWRDKMSYLSHFTPRMFRRVITPGEADQAVLRLPRWLAPLYYLVRPFRLVAKYLTKMQGTREHRGE